MGRKKDLMKSLDDEELELLNCKMYPVKSNVVDFKSTKVHIKCKNQHQKEFLKQLEDPKNVICFGEGAAGTGKSFISLSYSLKQLLNGNCNKITIIVPTCPSGGDGIEIGYLKGNYEDKISPFLEADIDTMKKILKKSGNVNYNDIINYFIKEGKIDFQIVNYIRGKSINGIILVNECEQFTKENLKLILTRIEDDDTVEDTITKVIITGDLTQCDRKVINNNKNKSGMEYAIETLKELDEVSVTRFDSGDVVRSKIVSKILDLWE